MTKVISNQTREDALAQFVEQGKQRILNNCEFCGLSFSDFATHYAEALNGGLFESFLKYAATKKFRTHDNIHINIARAESVIYTMDRYQVFILNTLNQFINAHMPEIEAEFDRIREENQAETMIAAAGF